MILRAAWAVVSFRAEFLIMLFFFVLYTVNDAINTHITSEFIDVMKNEKVKIQPVLLCAADLGGTGGRKEAMQQMLEKTKLSTDSFSSYQMLASKKYHLAEVNTSLELYNYGFQSCKSANTISTASPSFYSHPLLNQHMKILKAQILDSKEHKIKVIANITKLASLIKIWDISVNSNVHHFLRGFSGHLTNSRLWLFADLIDVLNELEGTPASSESAFAKDNNIGSWGSQLDNILRFAMVCNKSTGPIGQRRKPCKVFSSYKKQKGSNRKVVAMPKSPEETERPAEDGQNESSALPSFHRTKEKSVTSTLSPFRTTQQDAVIPIEAPTSQVSSNQDKLDANEDVNQDELDTNEDIISKSQPPYISQDEAADIKKLEEELHHIARQLKVTELLKASVTPLNITCGHYDSQKNLQSHLRNILAQSEEVTIPVSWLFLRGALEHSKNIFMKKAELCEIAKECGIVDENFKAFCKFFTSFGSIFDVSLKHKESDIIIIKTDEFLSKLSQTFDSITASHEQTSHYASDGIITTETVVKLDNTFMTALSQVGITVNIPAGKYGDGRKDVCYYMPCARKLKQDRSINQQAVRALLNIQCPVIINYEVTFTRYMLELCPASRLQSSHHENVTVITPDEDNDDVRVTIIYRGDEIGVKVEAKERHLRLKYATCVISIFEKIAEEAVQSCNCKAEEAVQSCNCVAFTYAFASKCNNEYHMLPHDLCDQCKENEELQVWMEALKKVMMQQT